MTNTRDKISIEYFALFIAWLFWGISQSLSRIQASKGQDSLKIIGIAAVQTLISYIVTLVAIWCIDKIRKNADLQRQLLYSACIVVFCSFLLAFVSVSMYNYLKGNTEIFWTIPKYLINGTEKIIFVGGYSAMFFFVRNLQQFQEQKSITEKAQQTARDAQLQVLQQQLNPHFLFNTLNSLRRLITIDENRARDMVTDLAEFLRFTLISSSSVHNTIKEELELVEYYLKIQKVRFQEDIQYQIDVDQALLDFTVPKFILQPLVENAVKYGMQTSPMPLNLSILAQKEKDRIRLEVINSGRLAEETISAHSNNGLKNTRLRLDLMYPNQSHLTLTETEGYVYSRININPI